jgi:hypothetical protein
MDKTLFKAYVRELVKETVEAEVKKVLPKLLNEAVAEVRSLQETTTHTPQKPKLSRSQLAEMMGLERIGDTVVATTKNIVAPPLGMSADNPAVQAINRDYSAVMKKMGLSK